MADNKQPTGRARGRARGTAKTEEEARASLRKPGEYPAHIQPPAQPAAPGAPGPGRGRGTSGDRGRGVSVERDGAPALGAGRAFHRGSITAPGSVVSVASPPSDISSDMSSLQLASDISSSVPGSSVTPGAAGDSIGRGATRGRRDRAPDFLVRTRSDQLTSKKGTGGVDVKLTSNYFPLIAKPNWRLLQYRVDMKPDIDMTKVRKGLLGNHRAVLPKYIFDGTMLFTTNRLKADDSPLILESKRESDGTIVVITIKLTNEVQPSDPSYMQFFNIILRSAMEKLQLEEIRRNYFDPKAAVTLAAHKLEIWPGYVTSIRQHEEQIMLCCEVSCKVLRTDTVYDQIQEIHKRVGGGPNFHRSVEKALLGAIVITRYNNQTYRVDEIDWDKTPSDEFDGRNGEKMSYQKYYSEKYNKSIRDPKQPLIITIPKIREQRSGNTGPIYLVPELCNMTGLSDEQRANFKLMQDMGAFTRQDPVKRTQTLKKFSERLNNNPQVNEDMKAWNLALGKDLVSLRARILEPETILGSKNKTATYKMDNADWSSCFRNWSQFSVVNLQKWAVVVPTKDAGLATEFVNSLKKVGPSLGMTVGNPKEFKLTDNRPATYVQTLDQVIKMGPSIIMVVIPNNKGDHYAAVKKKCVIEQPTPSQCITATVLNKPKGLMSVATKVAVQMNCKLGGEPWSVKIPMSGTMIIGYDTYHDTLHKGRSVGAVVASMNSSSTKFMSVANIHSNPQQELDDLICPAVSKALRKYHQLNGHLPSRIIMYRDGVGDGQIPYIVDHEIGAIKRSFQKAYGAGEELKFTYIIVSKRINTRFFKMNGQPSNPPSGTVVDDVVTLPERYDFFLVSQSVRQGTVNPTSYNVIEDGSGLKPEHIQKLTYKLCHLYYNWPGTVRVPAPCQYAHKLAFLVGESLHIAPSDKLEDTLYYL